MSAIVANLFRTKSVQRLQEEAADNGMNRTLGALDLVLIGVGDIIGAGIFVITGRAAAEYAGPAVILSFLFASVACAFAGLCYAELAAMIPVSGSAYTYTYAAFGEIFGWIMGFDLILEYSVGSGLVAQGWSAYFLKFLNAAFGITLSPTWTSTPWNWSEKHGFVPGDGYINLPAFLIVLVVTIVLVVGVRQSSVFNHVACAIKLVVILTFLFATVGYIDSNNWTPFIPGPEGDRDYGFKGVLRASFSVFFSYIGFDARDMPIGILGSLAVCSTLYILVALFLTGIAPFKTLNNAAPLANAVSALGFRWLTVFVSLGALAGLTSVQVVAMMAQPRVFYSMSKDGLLPEAFSKIHPKFKTPYVPTIVTGTVVGLASAFVPMDVLNDMTSSGTLFAFAMVCLAVGVLRFTRPDVERPFKVPLGPIIIPGLGVATCLFLLVSGGITSIIRLFVWMAIGLVIYGTYGYHHSKLRNIEDSDSDGSSADSGKLPAEDGKKGDA
ncbi:amino acid transporter [Catenaria anguillulae PL171]|uniref:Amino acid transporter n=1 Tax=Catenaria anguillulae PL171 TaxID=765915 RepID=A0A1Y2HZ02_9FUNG|nr:amino acid transporter [Catenaria anguillulae PL171]